MAVHLKKAIIAIGALLSTTSPIALAQSDESDEIIVTATFRGETLQDVPLSITTVTPERVFDVGAYTLQDLNGILPNVKINELSFSNEISIRGISSGNNQSFEQSVGIFRDGIYIGKSLLSRLPFTDLEQLEVLRGPQGTILGKNSVAGAVVLTTKKPTNELSAGFDSQIAIDGDFDLGINAYVNVPFSDRLRGRVSGRFRDSNGYLTNLAEDNRLEPQRDEYSVRAALQWDVTDAIVVDANYEHAEFDSIGRASQISQTANPAVFADSVLDDFNLVTNGGAMSLFEGSVRDDNFQNSDADIAVLKINADLGGGFRLQSTSGYARFFSEGQFDGDFGPLPLLTNFQNEDYNQFSTELRLLSPTDGRFSYVLGFYYEDNSYEFDEEIDLALPPSGFSSLVTDYIEDGRIISGFTEASFDVTQALSLTGGVRLSNVRKDATQSQFIAPILPIELSSPSDALDPSDPANGPVLGFFQFGLNVVPHTSIATRSETGVDWSVSLRYDAGNIQPYFTAARGFKAGGFDSRRAQPEGFAGPDDTFEFENETALTYELGLKTLLLDGALTWNTSLYRTSYNDLQQAIFLGGITFSVSNAAEATIQGIETDFSYALTDNLTIWGNGAYLDFEYDSFTNAPCTVAQAAAFAGPGVCSQDLTGRPGPSAPEFSGSVGFTYEQEISSKLSFFLSGNAAATSSQFLNPDLDQSVLQESFTKFNLKAGIGSSDGRWGLHILGQNLTDQIVAFNAGDVPLNPGTVFALTEPPRRVFVQLRANF